MRVVFVKGGKICTDLKSGEERIVVGVRVIVFGFFCSELGDTFGMRVVAEIEFLLAFDIGSSAVWQKGGNRTLLLRVFFFFFAFMC